MTSAWEPAYHTGGKLVGIDGHLIVAIGRNGDMVLAETSPEAYREKGRFRPLTGQTWVAPVVADGRLVNRNRKSMVTVDLR